MARSGKVALHPDETPKGHRVLSTAHPDWGPGTVLLNRYQYEGDYLIVVHFDNPTVGLWGDGQANFCGFGDLTHA